jgi:hypothetical protein
MADTSYCQPIFGVSLARSARRFALRPCSSACLWVQRRHVVWRWVRNTSEVSFYGTYCSVTQYLVAHFDSLSSNKNVKRNLFQLLTTSGDILSKITSVGTWHKSAVADYVITFVHYCGNGKELFKKLQLAKKMVIFILVAARTWKLGLLNLL